MKKEKPDDEKGLVKEPDVVYDKRIVFSSLENQNDIQLEYALSRSYSERLSMLYELNAYAFSLEKNSRVSWKNARIKFSPYEYIP